MLLQNQVTTSDQSLSRGVMDSYSYWKDLVISLYSLKLFDWNGKELEAISRFSIRRFYLECNFRNCTCSKTLSIWYGICECLYYHDSKLTKFLTMHVTIQVFNVKS